MTEKLYLLYFDVFDSFYLYYKIYYGMEFYQGNIYHIYNRGNNSQQIFFEKENYLFFLEKMRRHLLPHCEIMAWCLMPNHFHWMVKVKSRDQSGHSSNRSNDYTEISLVTGLNKDIGILLRSYTRAVNSMYNKTGSLFQPKTKAKSLNPEITDGGNYPLICFLYLHQNPLRARLVQRMQDWKFSSYRDYALKRKGLLCNKKLTRRLLELPNASESFIQLSQKTVPDEYVEKIF